MLELTAKVYWPLIPYPESFDVMQQDSVLLHHLKSAGTLFPVNWDALTGWLGPQAEKLVPLPARKQPGPPLCHRCTQCYFSPVAG